jgi:hypothetical protein
VFHSFVFRLCSRGGALADAPIPSALFTMRWEDEGPVTALVITPSPSGDEAEVVNLRAPDSTHTVSLKRE